MYDKIHYKFKKKKKEVKEKKKTLKVGKLSMQVKTPHKMVN